MEELAQRRLRLNLSRDNVPRHVSRIFPSEISFVCGNTLADAIVVGLEGFISQVWRADLSQQIGQDLDETVLVGNGTRPKEMVGASLSPDGTLLAVKTSFYDPPNLQQSWFSLWDVKAGMPIGGRIRFADDGFSSDGGVPDLAAFSLDGSAVHFLEGCGQKCQAISSIEIRVPSEHRTNISRIAEAIAGIRYDSSGALQLVPDSERRSALVPLLTK